MLVLLKSRKLCLRMIMLRPKKHLLKGALPKKTLFLHGSKRKVKLVRPSASSKVETISSMTRIQMEILTRS